MQGTVLASLGNVDLIHTRSGITGLRGIGVSSSRQCRRHSLPHLLQPARKTAVVRVELQHPSISTRNEVLHEDLPAVGVESKGAPTTQVQSPGASVKDLWTPAGRQRVPKAHRVQLPVLKPISKLHLRVVPTSALQLLFCVAPEVRCHFALSLRNLSLT